MWSLHPRWEDGGQTRQLGSCVHWPMHVRGRCLCSCRAGLEPLLCWNSDLLETGEQLCTRCCVMAGFCERALSSHHNAVLQEMVHVEHIRCGLLCQVPSCSERAHPEGVALCIARVHVAHSFNSFPNGVGGGNPMSIGPATSNNALSFATLNVRRLWCQDESVAQCHPEFRERLSVALGTQGWSASSVRGSPATCCGFSFPVCSHSALSGVLSSWSFCEAFVRAL